MLLICWGVTLSMFIQKWDFLFKREFFVAIDDLHVNDILLLTKYLLTNLLLKKKLLTKLLLTKYLLGNLFLTKYFLTNLMLTKCLLTNLLLLMEVASMSELVESESPRPHYSETGLGDLAIKLTNNNKYILTNKHLKHDCMIVLTSRWNSQFKKKH